MTIVPLPPHLERFVRDQLAAGRFQSEYDVIRAALERLEEEAPPPRPDARYASADAAASRRRNPRGLLADVYQGITPEDIDEARREMWSNLLRDGA